MVKASSVMLRHHRFQVSTDHSCLYAPSASLKIWIKIFYLDYDMRGYHGLEAVIKSFGNLLDLDFPTRTQSDLRWARVFIEVADLTLLPPFLWFEVRRPNGWVSYIRVRYELDTTSSPMGSLKVLPQPITVVRSGATRGGTTTITGTNSGPVPARSLPIPPLQSGQSSVSSRHRPSTTAAPLQPKLSQPIVVALMSKQQAHITASTGSAMPRSNPPLNLIPASKPVSSKPSRPPIPPPITSSSLHTLQSSSVALPFGSKPPASLNPPTTLPLLGPTRGCV
jgi:hypothetical protein